MTHEEQLTATAQDRRYQIREPKRSAKTGRRTLYRLFDGEWMYETTEGSTAWNVKMDMIRRGWAMLDRTAQEAGL